MENKIEGNQNEKRNRGRPRNDPDKHSKDKDQAKEYQKQYYEKNKEKLLNEMKTKVACEYCFRNVNKYNLPSHQKSQLCKKKRYKVFELMTNLKRLTDNMNIPSDGYDKFINKFKNEKENK